MHKYVKRARKREGQVDRQTTVRLKERRNVKHKDIYTDRQMTRQKKERQKEKQTDIKIQTDRQAYRKAPSFSLSFLTNQIIFSFTKGVLL
jgi:hypothetical protein